MTVKYAQIINEKTKEVCVGLGNNVEFYKSIGMEEIDVEQAWNGAWYLKGYAPKKPEPSMEEKVKAKEAETGLTRAVREIILGNEVTVSEYVQAQAQEIEALATPLREAEQ